MKFVLLLTFLLAITVVSADRFAVLIAGSNGWYNYRHQADVCHGYQSLLNKGVAAANIIVLSYNDVAPNSQNPFPNKLFNAPSKSTGWDVNKGCVLDYTGSEITPDNYMSILKGDKSAMAGVGTGRVLESTSEDEVFLAFYDHGGSGILGFPDNQLMYANDFQDTLKTMHTQKMFKTLVYYMEACESGSMWQNFPTDINVYALSAANATESSWGTYCPGAGAGSIVDGTDIGTCLGDLFSINWMENLDQANTISETLEEQWTTVHKETTKSSVLQWGSLGFTKDVIGLYFGEKNSKFRPAQPSQKQQALKIESAENSRLIKLNFFKRQWESDKTNAQKRQEYEAAYSETQYFNNVFKTIKEKGQIAPTEGPLIINDYSCLKQMVSNFEKKCQKFGDYGLQFVRVLAEMCEHSDIKTLEAKNQLIDTICSSVGKESEYMFASQ